jgi:protein TonB
MFEPKTFEPKTLKPKAIVPQTNRQFLNARPARRPAEKTQQRLMVGALVLLLAALGLLLYKDRDFWFPDTQEAEDQTEETVPATTTPAQQPAATTAAPMVAKKQHNARPQTKVTPPAELPGPPVNATPERTVLPPLEVEVVAGDSRRKVHPGTNSVRVDLQPGTAPQAVSEGGNAATGTAASVTSNAAERVEMSAETANIVTHSVRPGYPLLARRANVQGSVILQALISREGTIQDLHVIKGPPILVGAAEEAVKQWRFKPHYMGNEAVETQAKITVNFTISTN